VSVLYIRKEQCRYCHTVLSHAVARRSLSSALHYNVLRDLMYMFQLDPYRKAPLRLAT
jgi:hypothetical protein